MVQPLWKTVWRFLKELKRDLPYDPAIVLLAIYPKDSDAMKHRDTCTPMFLAAMATIAKLWKELRCLSKDEWIKKMWCMYTLYVLIHLGNINNSEREYKGREKKCVGNIRKGDRT